MISASESVYVRAVSLKSNSKRKGDFISDDLNAIGYRRLRHADLVEATLDDWTVERPPYQ